MCICIWPLVQVPNLLLMFTGSYIKEKYMYQTS